LLDGTAFPTSLLFSESEKFQEHLQKRSDGIKAAITDLFTKIPSANPDAAKLQEQVTKLLAQEKEHLAELQRVTADNQQLSERQEAAVFRAMKAEKRIDRLKSAQVAKLEQGPLTASDDPVAVKREPSAGVNGDTTASEEVEAERKQAVAAAEKRREQMEQLEAANKSLTEELSTLKTRLFGLTDEDYAKTDLFKNLKSQHEDLIKRINDLEATNIQLREDTRKLTEEQTNHRIQVDEESRTVIGEVQGQLAKMDTDLTRVRNMRDELSADLQIQKASKEQTQASREKLEELVASRADQIQALETEVERLKVRVGEIQGPDPSEALAQMGEEELRQKVASLEKEYSLLSDQLPSMEAAYKKANAVASKKIGDAAALEESVSRSMAEKAKADQKYFGAMKAKEAREIEVRTLRAHQTTSAKMVQGLKDTEASLRGLIVNLEKQIADLREQTNGLTQECHSAKSKLEQQTQATETTANQITELKKMIKEKDDQLSERAKEDRKREVELNELQVRLAETKKSLISWKKKGLGDEGDAEEVENLRTLAYCTVCRRDIKNTLIKSCGHIFCKKCVDDRLQFRNRKCPTCGKSFGINDHMRVAL
jgi:E3 ubiquitin-protein ligase BRE1